MAKAGRGPSDRGHGGMLVTGLGLARVSGLLVSQVEDPVQVSPGHGLADHQTIFTGLKSRVCSE